MSENNQNSIDFDVIKQRAQAVTPDIKFFRSLGGQLCADWPRRIWENDEQCRTDRIFHNHAPADMLALIAEIERLRLLQTNQEQTEMPRIPSADEIRSQVLDNGYYERAVETINKALPDAYGVSGYGVCHISSNTPAVVIERLRTKYQLKGWLLTFEESGHEGWNVHVERGQSPGAAFRSDRR